MKIHNLRLLFCVLIIYTTSGISSNEVSPPDEKKDVLMNVNHVIDFLQTMKKSQDEMFGRIEMLTKSVEANDREEHKSRVRLQRKITSLETKVTEIEKNLPAKIEELVKKLMYDVDNTRPRHPPSFYTPNPRTSRDIAYFEPFRDPNHNTNIRPTYLRSPERGVADKFSFFNVQLLEESRKKMADFNTTLESMRHTIFDVGRTMEQLNETRSKDLDWIKRSESELEEKVSSTSKDVLALRQKQAELQRVLDSVLIHFSTLVLGLQNQDKKIEETRRNITEEIQKQIFELQTSLNQQQLGIGNANVAVVGETVWPIDNKVPGLAALVNDEPKLTGFQKPTKKLQGQYKSMQSNQYRSSEFSGLINNLTEEVKTQGEQITKLSSELAKVNVSQILLSRTMDEETLKRAIRPKDCSEIRLFRNVTSGTHSIFPRLNDDDPVEVLCDLETDGGGWTVIQRRGHPLNLEEVREDFFRNWTEYEQGFGTLDGDFWIGLSNIAALCKLGDQELRIEMTKWNGEKSSANYKHFKIDDVKNLYQLNVSGYSGDAGDSLSRHNGMGFSTKDRDNDSDPQRHCAQMWMGAWWYYGCHESNLNGMYAKEGSDGSHDFGTGIIWFHWTGNYYSLKHVEIKIRNNFIVRNKS